MHPRRRVLHSVFALLITLVLVMTTAASAQVPSKEWLQFLEARGKSGTSYRYVGQLGETAVPYLTDNEHLNRPEALFIDRSNNHLYVSEEVGYRVIHYDASFTPQWSVGKPGISQGHLENVLNHPYDMAKAPDGTIWIADNSRLMQYDSDGVFLQVFPDVDPWRMGEEHGRFNNANGIAFDSEGRMYISDRYNHRIEVFTFDTLGVPVYDKTIGDGWGEGVNEFKEPHRISIDTADNLYIADSANNRIKKCTYAAASESWTCAIFKDELVYPNGVETYGADVVYIANTDAHQVLKCVSGVCSDFLSIWTMDIGIDSQGNIYTVTPWSLSVHKFGPTGTDLGVVVGDPDVPYFADNEHFVTPRLAIDAQDNRVITEETGQRLLKFSPENELICKIGLPGIGSDVPNQRMDWPRDVAFDANGNMYVANATDIRIYSPNCAYVSKIGPLTGGPAGERFTWIGGVAVAPNGLTYISDVWRHRVLVYNQSRKLVGEIGDDGTCGPGTNPVQFCKPLNLATDTTGNLYVSDQDNNRVLKLNPQGQVLMTLGVTRQWGDDYAHLSSPEDLLVDRAGRIFISNIWEQNVRVYDPNGGFIASIGGEYGEGAEQSMGLSSVAVDSAGNIYTGDLTGSRIQIYSPGVSGWLQINLNGFGLRATRNAGPIEEFQGQLYAGAVNWDQGAQIWRANSSWDWTPVSQPSFGEETLTGSIIDLIVFDNQLYAGTAWTDGKPGQIWRSADGTTWNKVLDMESIDPENVSVYSFAIFDGKLYASMFSDTGVHGAELWSTTTGASGQWSMAHRWTDTNQISLISMQVFDGFLYGVIENKVTGLEVWRSPDGANWNLVTGDGFGNSNNVYPGGMVIFDGDLYVTTVTNNGSSGEIWRSSNGTDWEQVDTTPFQSDLHRSVISPIVFNKTLYVFVEHDEGLQTWMTTDGENWTMAAPSGFGTRYNSWSALGTNSVAIYNGSIVKGTWNETMGGQLWKMLPLTFYLPINKR